MGGYKGEKLALTDLRLGQLLINAVRPPSPCPELFYAEDDKLIEGLARYMAARQSAQQ